MPHSIPPITENQKLAFFASLAETGRCYTAARVAGFSYGTARKYVNKDEDFEARYDDSMEAWRDKLRQITTDRGIVGWQEPVFGRDGVIGTKTRYDHRLLELHLKAHCPEMREKMQIDHDVKGGVLVVREPAKTVDEWIERNKVPTDVVR